MTQLTNGQHACMLVFVPMVDILNLPCDSQFVLSVFIYNCIRHIGSHIQYKKEAIYSKQYDEKVNNSVTIFNNTFDLVT